ncbi:hypothetical protein [uncultured Flavonifractor sp.]|uniref:hypothetical protein n=1 Tax=uncultured Flavonifractor sp. TaxID=1193534 RepID=UPI002636095E|nr:hypothetical protein [uncultured Flavonifractor sp.]
MKRISVLVLVLALLSAGVLAGASVAVQRQGSHVTVEAETLAGDPSAAEGLELSLPVYCQNAMLWDMTVPAARPEDTAARFACSSFGLRNADFNIFNLFIPYLMLRSVSVEPDPLKIELPSSSFSVPSVNSSYHWMEAVQLVADETPAGEALTCQVKLAEVYDCWPMEVYLDGNGMWFDPVGQTFADYFPIPIPQDYQVEITIQKNERGRATSVDMEADPRYAPDCTCDFVQAGDAILFILNVQYVDENTGAYRQADGSAIPGGWGVYRLTTSDAKTEGSLETLFSLPEGSMARRFWASADGSNLFLLAEEEDVLRLRVFDEDMNLLDTVDLLPLGPEAAFYSLVQGEDYFVAIASDQDCFRFVVVAREDGAWTPAFSAHTLAQEQSGYSFYSMSSSEANVLGVDYTQGRLAVCATNYDLEPGFYLSVYDRDGLAYLGRYTSSLSPAGAEIFSGSLGMEFGSPVFDTLSPDIRWQRHAEEGGGL